MPVNSLDTPGAEDKAKAEEYVREQQQTMERTSKRLEQQSQHMITLKDDEDTEFQDLDKNADSD